MKVALSGIDLRDGALLSKVKKTLESLTVKTQIMKDDDDYRTAKEVDLVMVAGGDRGILDYFHKIEYDSAPVLGIYETDSTGFLAQLDVRELESATSQLKRGSYSVEEVFRLAVRVDGKQADPVLNDVAVFPSKSATLMEHVLRIDANDIWHDKSDGVIISTPTGSTAYSMSAGGPMVLQKALVFLVVSVNSLDNTRRPLIVPNQSKLEITDIISRYHCEVVLDGGHRIQIKNNLEWQQACISRTSSKAWRPFFWSITYGKESKACRGHAKDASKCQTNIEDTRVRRIIKPEGLSCADNAPGAHNSTFSEPPYQPRARKKEDLASRCPAEDI